MVASHAYSHHDSAFYLFSSSFLRTIPLCFFWSIKYWNARCKCSNRHRACFSSIFESPNSQFPAPAETLRWFRNIGVNPLQSRLVPDSMASKPTRCTSTCHKWFDDTISILRLCARFHDLAKSNWVFVRLNLDS